MKIVDLARKAINLWRRFSAYRGGRRRRIWLSHRSCGFDSATPRIALSHPPKNPFAGSWNVNQKPVAYTRERQPIGLVHPPADSARSAPYLSGEGL